jgi:hypothetical protein
MAMLQECPPEVKDRITAIFKSHIDSTYGSAIAEWCFTHWRNIAEQQLNIIKSLKGVYEAAELLLLSLVV